MSEEYAKTIMGMPLFQGYTVHGANRLVEDGDIRELPAETLICREGDAPDFVLLILKGKLQVFVERNSKEMVLVDSGPGTILGELAVLCGIPRSASIRAIEDSVVLQWSARDFYKLMLGDVFLSQQIFRNSLKLVLDKEKALIESLSSQA